MRNNQILKSNILSSGIYLPEQIVSSDEIFAEFNSEIAYGIPKNWMSENMGILERRMASPECQPSDLAIPAAREAINNCLDLNPDHIDLLIFCGIERDQPEPATAHTIQSALGLKANIAFDVANACFGFIDSLMVAKNMIAAGTIRYALIVTGEVPTRLTRSFVDQLKRGMSATDARKVIGFLSVGDAGGAVIVGPSRDDHKSGGFEAFTIATDSAHRQKCYYRHKANGDVEGQMQMAKIVAYTLRLQKTIFEPTLSKAGWKAPDFLLTHQVGKKSFNDVAELGITPVDRMIKSYDLLGNITSATFPINHHALMNDERLKTGDKVYGCYSGSGLVVGQFAYTH